MPKKVIVHVVNSNIFSGLERVACNIIDNFKNEYELIYVTKDGLIVDYLKKKNIKYFLIEKMSIKEIKRMVNALKPDIIHAHDFRASVIVSLSINKIPIISHLHNNCPWLKSFNLYSILYFLCSFKISKILIVSDSIKNEYIFFKYIKNKFICIKNPLKRADILNSISKKSNKKVYDICCVGRLTKQKNPIRFIKIIAKLKEKIPDIKVIWVGNGELLEEVESISKEMDLSSNIDFVGFKDNPYEYMNKSKIFMLTSSWEGFGLVVFEALTLGLPCIVSDVGGLVNLVNDSCGKICKDDNSYINICYELLTNNQKYLEFSNNAIIESKKLENYDDYMYGIKVLYEEFYREK